jgi:sugar lactone lactonase YvrE
MLEAKSEKFWQLVDKNAAIKQVATGFTFTEGPVFSRRGYLLFSDIPNQKIHKWERGQVTTIRENSNNANGLTFDHQGRLLAAEGGGKVTRTEKNGTITVLADAGLEGPNDLVYAIDGSVYFSDLPKSRVYQITRERSGVGGAPPERRGPCRRRDPRAQRRRIVAQPAATLRRRRQDERREDPRHSS